MTILNVTAIPGSRPPAPVQALVLPVAPVPAPQPLAPAVNVDIRGSGRTPADARQATAQSDSADETRPQDVERRLRIDQDTKTVVYQVVDPSSGDIVVQLPDAVILKARAYADAAAVRAAKTERPLDKIA